MAGRRVKTEERLAALVKARAHKEAELRRSGEVIEAEYNKMLEAKKTIDTLDRSIALLSPPRQSSPS